MFYLLGIILILFILIGIKLYKVKKFKQKILKIIFILQNINIDSYYDEYLLKEIIKGNDVEDHYDKLYGNELNEQIANIPSKFDLFFSFKKYTIENWMGEEFNFKYNLFVKDKIDYLYHKYKTKVYTTKIFLMNKK